MKGRKEMDAEVARVILIQGATVFKLRSASRCSWRIGSRFASCAKVQRYSTQETPADHYLRVAADVACTVNELHLECNHKNHLEFCTLQLAPEVEFAVHLLIHVALSCVSRDFIKCD